jgi:hypothetical protein
LPIEASDFEAGKRREREIFVNPIAHFTDRPADVLGMHFFSPANIMRLLEVVRGKATAADTLATVMQTARQIRKLAVVSGVCDGFIGNRMLLPYLAQAFALLEEGCVPARVDRAIEKSPLAIRRETVSFCKFGGSGAAAPFSDLGVVQMVCNCRRFDPYSQSTEGGLM